MRIVATSDTHFVPVQGWIPDGDVFIHAGDLMQDGYPSEWQERVDWLESLPHKKKILVCGNHDFHLQVYPGPALQNLRSAGVLVVGKPAFRDIVELPNGMTLLGLPGVSGMRNWAFNWNPTDLIKYVHSFKGEKVDIVVSHSPLKGLLDWSEQGEGGHAGINEYWTILRDCKPKVWIHGHIHEAYGHFTVDNNGNVTEVYNVAMCNRSYRHQNPPMVIDV